MSVYAFTEGLRTLTRGVSLNAKMDADLVYNEVRDLKDEFDEIVPEDVVKRARPKRSPMHKLFEWDDSIAGEKYREEQARYVLRVCRVQYADKQGKPKTVRAFPVVETRKDESRRNVFVPIEDITHDYDRQDEILNRALHSLVDWRRKWREVTDWVEANRATEYVDMAIDLMREKVSGDEKKKEAKKTTKKKAKRKSRS